MEEIAIQDLIEHLKRKSLKRFEIAKILQVSDLKYLEKAGEVKLRSIERSLFLPVNTLKSQKQIK